MRFFNLNLKAKLAASAIGVLASLGVLAAPASALDAPAFICSFTVGTPVSSFLISDNCAGTGTHILSGSTHQTLMIDGLMQCTSTTTSEETVAVQFNSDTGSNYDSDLLAVSTSFNSTSAQIASIPCKTGTNTHFAGAFHGRITDAVGTTFNKVGHFDFSDPYGSSWNGSLFMWHPSTAQAISSITFKALNGLLFSTGSTVAIYAE